MIFSENRFALCANAALRVGIMLELIVGLNLSLEIVAIHPNPGKNSGDQQGVHRRKPAPREQFRDGHGRGSME
jgi:hypothetical protein